MREPRPHLPVGTRVRHWGHQYSRALFEGTGVVALVSGPYYGGFDWSWEYLVYRDEEDRAPEWWPSYGTIAMEDPRCWPECILACSAMNGRGMCRFRRDEHDHEQQEAHA